MSAHTSPANNVSRNQIFSSFLHFKKKNNQQSTREIRIPLFETFPNFSRFGGQFSIFLFFGKMAPTMAEQGAINMSKRLKVKRADSQFWSWPNGQRHVVVVSVIYSTRRTSKTETSCSHPSAHLHMDDDSLLLHASRSPPLFTLFMASDERAEKFILNYSIGYPSRLKCCTEYSRASTFPIFSSMVLTFIWKIYQVPPGGPANSYHFCEQILEICFFFFKIFKKTCNIFDQWKRERGKYINRNTKSDWTNWEGSRLQRRVSHLPGSPAAPPVHGADEEDLQHRSRSAGAN